MTFTVGTRGSALALAQTALVTSRLGVSVTVTVIRTIGDASVAPLTELGEGVFVTALEQALVRGEIDLAVHSLKDLPTGEHPDLHIAAILEREDPRDALITSSRGGLPVLPPSARLGTSSPRRAAFLRCLAPGIAVSAIRGNVETRMRKVASGEYDATVLALAGLRRLGLPVKPVEILTLRDCPPAPGQGAIAVQCRRGDARVGALLAPLDHGPTRLACTAERALLRALGASCMIALGAHGHRERGTLVLDAALATAEGVVRSSVSGDDPLVLGARAAEALLRRPVRG